MDHKNLKIIIVPNGGLANRMRAIASAYTLSRDSGRDLEVIWYKNKELNCPYTSIFRNSDNSLKIIEPAFPVYKLFYEYPRKRNLFISKIVSFFKNSSILLLSKEISKRNVMNFVEKAKGDIIINSGINFYEYNPDLLRKLFPFSKLVETTKESILDHREPDFAVQIRRTDNKNSIKQSPLKLFEKSIDQELETHPSAIFFLATDDQTIKQQLAAKYGGHVIYNSHPAKRNSSDGIIEASAEFKILSECRKIYGSYWSSFSEIAALYGDKELIVVKSKA